MLFVCMNSLKILHSLIKKYKINKCQKQRKLTKNIFFIKKSEVNLKQNGNMFGNNFLVIISIFILKLITCL